MIEAIDLTVRRRGRTLLDAVSFDVRPGQVTGVLGGTGAGKTTLLRRMVELERGGGETLFDGSPYRSLRHPMREVGLFLEPGVGHPQRTVRGHLHLELATDRRAAREGTTTGVRRPPPMAMRRIERASFGASGSSIPASWHGQPQSSAGASTGANTAIGTNPRTGTGNIRILTGPPTGTYLGDTSAGVDSGLADRVAVNRGGSPAARIDDVLGIVGLTEQAETRLADLTDGMATRLGIAVALLGDPKALVFDAPERGLEPEGVAWLGALLRAFTAQGRAALVTGSDTETLVGLADRILLLDSGYLVGTRTAEEVLRAPTGAAVIVRSPQIVRFAAILAEAGARSTQGDGACLEVRGLDRARVGDLAFRYGIPVHELSERFTGSDPGDAVLAACSGRSRPVVPLQGSPETSGILGIPEVSGVAGVSHVSEVSGVLRVSEASDGPEERADSAACANDAAAAAAAVPSTAAASAASAASGGSGGDAGSAEATEVSR